ncbi:914_t:CDS:2 [Paraglomus brasilianum]|uniref:914_t:CDS:1 n=1 Tax=Paraglomus brasilianum TaxID=144538 RepID=A0A9N9B7M6_9GLOM|nr:914_t:CDS:2 [Paraglomus brasilianum]
MSSARPSRHHHGIRYASADHDRLKRALLQPVQAWEKKWQYPVGGGKNFMLYKWVKCNRKMTFDDEDDEYEDNQQHHQAEDTPTPTAFSLAPPTEASTPLPSESDENRLLRPPPALTSAKSTSSLRGSSVPSAVSTPLANIGVNTPQEAESSAVDSPYNDEDEEMVVVDESSTNVTERKEGVISSSTIGIGDGKIEGAGIVSEGSTEKIEKADNKEKQDEVKLGEDKVDNVSVGGIDNINIGSIDNTNIGSIDSINIGGIDNISIGVIDKTNINNIDNTNINSVVNTNISDIDNINISSIVNNNISSIGNTNISDIDNINISSIGNTNISDIDNINISSGDNISGNIDSVDNISIAVNMDIFGDGHEAGGEKEEASQVGGLKVGAFWNPAGESTAHSSEIGEQNSPYQDVGVFDQGGERQVNEVGGEEGEIEDDFDLDEL